VALAFFLDWIPTSALGLGGNPRDGHFLPPIPNRRRMFAGVAESPIISPQVVGEATRQ
jgi:3-methylfumaryl-CoA hydratase